MLEEEEKDDEVLPLKNEMIRKGEKVFEDSNEKKSDMKSGWMELGNIVS